MGTNTGIGIGIGIPFKNNALGGDRPYLPPELKARLIGVWDNYGKKNTDADRNIIKNKIPNAGGDLEILNAAYEGMSGCNGYPVVFGANKTWESLSGVYGYTSDITNTTIHVTHAEHAGNGLLFSYVKKDGALANIKEIPAFRVTIGGLEGNSKFGYRYLATEDATEETLVYLGNGTHELAKSFAPTKVLLDLTRNVWVGIFITPMVEGEVVFDCDITIEVLPKFEGAFVTDGIDDLITSTKTLQEMGITDEITVVSMIHKISSDNNWTNLIGELKGDHTFVANRGINTDKTGIYGYTYNYNKDAIVINNILGDKNDYIVKTSTSLGLDNKYYVTGFTSTGIIKNVSQIAWYWTFIANRVLTTDEINQVIAYYNLDRTLRPDILCNIIKQGITNDNHADFNDKLVDYSGNGRDIQLNNIAWKGGSGIAAKPFETIKDYLIVPDEGLQELTIYNEFSYKVKSIKYADRYWIVQSVNKTDTSYPVTIITDKDIVWRNALNYTDADGVKGSVRKETNVPANTPTQVFIYGFNDFDISDDYTKVNCVAYATRKDITEFTVTFIPSYKGGLLLDGIADFGKVTGMPIYKDYTVVADREIIDGLVENADGGVALKGSRYLTGAFCFDYKDAAFSFGTPKMIPLDTKRFISYQSKYVSNGISINIGTATDNDELWIGRLGNDERYSKIAIRFLMSFPYSMSEFLIERQLKKHKLGTLYPDMVEFRPVIKTNVDYTVIQFYINNYTKRIYPGDYIPINTPIQVNFYLKNNVDELISFKVNGNDSTFKRSKEVDNAYNIETLPITKSPQKINITIDEYIRFEDIVQPYPVLLRFNDENGNEVSWGGKVKLGSSITRIGSFNDCNLLKGIYTVSNAKLNGSPLPSTPHVVERQMVFTCTATYLLDDNEPKCILSPRLLRIPNSSYKILGYIPDISGHGNHGKINNSAYAEGSGVNEDGSYQFDGVDDFVTIPTVAGKQVLMKLNWQNKALGNLIYDQRDNDSTTSFAIMPVNINDSTNNKIAYQARNANGITYIDGIRNEYIESYSLENIIHNITITNPDVSNKTVALGASNKDTADYFAKYALYDFMLFDNISTDDKIKQLNEYVGIEGNTE